MKSVQNIQLAIYATILSLTLVWLVITIANTAVLAFRELEFLPCAGGSQITTQQNGVSPSPSPSPSFEVDYSLGETLSKVLEEEEEEGKKEENPSSQNVLMPPPPPPPIDGNSPDNSNSNKKSNLIVSDLLVKTPKINIFASLTRDFSPIANRLNDQSRNTTVLAPLNSAINALPRKPWEDPADYKQFGETQAYSGPDGQDRARRNLQRFVEAHLVPVSPWREGEEVETVGGGAKIKWIKEGDTVFIEPGHIEVDSLASEVSNGNVWVLKGVVNYR